MPKNFQEKFSEELTPLLSFCIARNHYVVGRVCFLNNLQDTACLLAHQSIELYAKAIIWLAPEKYYFAKKPDPTQPDKVNVWGHELKALIKVAQTVTLKLSEILDSEMACNFLDYLYTAYAKKRFGIASNLARGNEVTIYDWVVQIIDTAYLDELGANELERRLYVPQTFREDFVRSNHAFSEDRIGDWVAKYLYTLPNRRTDRLRQVTKA